MSRQNWIVGSAVFAVLNGASMAVATIGENWFLVATHSVVIGMMFHIIIVETREKK